MKTSFLILSVSLFATLAASGQVAPGRNQRINAPVQGANNSGSAEYAAVSVGPRAGGAYNQGNFGQNFGQQGRMRRGAQYVSVSIAPRR